jgi:2-polyprenyl-6-methoxyphenol hydroxylase-like FAD-dependent oxidoreductase
MELRADVAVVGGGLGGVAAALAAAGGGQRVVLTEGSDWLGGQLTSQAVPPDEHPWIEQFGCTATYRRLRDSLRAHYRRWYPLSPVARAHRHLNPGRAVVSMVAAEPRAWLAVLEGMLAPHRTAGTIRVLTGHEPVAASVDGDRVTSVTLQRADGVQVVVLAEYVLDATDTGALLRLSGAEHVTGAESRERTGEPHAAPAAAPLDMQAVSWCFAVDHLAGQDHVIERPASYGFWRRHQPPAWGGPLLSLTAPLPRTGERVTRTFTPNPDRVAQVVDHRQVGGDLELWTFRRIAARETFQPGFLASDITVVNWPMIDYVEGPVLGVAPAEVARHRAGARELSLSFLYWLQTEAPRPDGGTGYPGLRLRPDVVGTADGLALRPYVRESARIAAQYTVVEQDVAAGLDRCGPNRCGPVRFPDTVGVGSYRIDLHPTTGGQGYVDIAARPFEIPLRSMIPIRLENLLPAGKNLGTTHVTNGCFRLHPVEWCVGEVAGELAAFCLRHGYTPQQVAARPDLVASFQHRLRAAGVELSWPGIHAY